MYYSERKTREYCPDDLSRSKRVEYRIRVIDFLASEANPFNEANTHVIEPPDKDKPTIWFKCDRFEEIRKLTSNESENHCGFLTFQDFEHAENVDLAKALQATIPPIKCVASIVVTQTNWHEVQS